MDTDEFAGSKAQALLDAHVAYLAARLQGPALQFELERRVDWVLADAARLRLGDVISEASIKQTAIDYAAHMRLGGGIPALVGDIAAAVYEHPVHEHTTLAELLPDREFEELLDKLLEMQRLREEVIHHSVSNPVFANLVAQLLYSGLRGYVAQGGRLAARVPGAGRALKIGRAVVDRASPRLGDALERGIRRYVARNTEAGIQASAAYLHDAFESEALRQAVLDFWDDHKHRSVASVRDVAGQLDIQELFVIGYEYWQRLRRTPIYREVIERGVEVFFDTYRDTTLVDLLDDIGVTRDMIVRDGMRFLPQVVDALRAEGLLEPALRRQLEDFYRSEAVADILR
ncbi:hypothetical protein SSPSH_001527 [Salinisphaera shabanensis E1L3A]|jgi:hypothetical protein|uniref:Uncharacterized protein n=1 Tax=Salinisphaera shabanensis E1L3A TaxID=1033802 RepID=U2FU19_9GAMM|nr:hypothetical protein [Salinisphaera shabanensis]ERJ19459.1 hypothetical protein SSPSH_001527 [Salinisphaera shabanensis E1L3A]